MICVGLIGSGFMGRAHSAAYEKCELVDKVKILTIQASLEQAEELMGEYKKVVSVETDAKIFLASGVDVIDICTPTPSHAELIRQAINLNKPTLCEKPLTLESCLGEELVEEARQAGVIFMVAQAMRFWPEYKYLADIIKTRTLGQLRNISMFRYSPKPGWGVGQWFKDLKVSGGALFDLHIHDIDYLQSAMGIPKRLSAVGYKSQDIAYTDIASVLDFSDGFYASVYASYDMPASVPFHMGYRALFENGLLDYDTWRDDPLKCYQGNEETIIDLSTEPNGYEQECEYFIRCAANAKTPELSTAESSLKTIKILEHIVDSAEQQGKWMELSRVCNCGL